MAKTKISEFDTNPDLNTDINSINIAEGCAPSGINNAIRTLMSDLKEWQSGAQDIYIAPAGTAAAPSWTFNGDLDTGFYRVTANELGVAAGGSAVGRFTSAGFVGNVTGNATNVTGTVAVANGGTGATTLASGQFLKGAGTSAVTTSATVALGSEVAGTLPIANGGTGQTTALAAFDALKQSASTTYVGAVELATSAEVQTGTDTTRAITPDALRQGALVRATAQATTSGTFIDFTGIPSWVKRITIMFAGVSTNGTDSFLVQVGTSSGVTTTGYVSTGVGNNGSGGGTVSSTSGFAVRLIGASGALSGHMLLTNISSNSWVSSHTAKTDNTGVVDFGAGDVSLSGTLDRVRITTVNGTDAFDAGSVNIIYE